ncbi:hypothetical protein [Bradyrhizobium elkanii]|uniref:hypothetical protein n=1 Tax=Bradyrhizobium elkanii TaxID=29448 RepID=UPI00272BF53B|nr:hypothetical protein [Bradyrhizobium elkanii]WLA80267.1 hypothetical protein QNJ99_33515 [Bradyrhizobium elkanii]
MPLWFEMFAPAWLQSFVAFLWSWATVDIVVGLAATAVAVLLPPWLAFFIPDLRKWAIATAVVAFTLTGTIAYGFKNGLDEKQRQWDAALASEAVSGEKALTDAERTVGPISSDRRVFDNDPDNRDRDSATDRKQDRERPKGPLRRLVPNSLFGK